MVRRPARRDDLDRVARLLEEEGRLAARVGTALQRVGRVVAADAVDPAHGKDLVAARDGNRRMGDGERRAGLGACARGAAPERAGAEGRAQPQGAAAAGSASGHQASSMLRPAVRAPRRGARQVS